MKPTKIYAEYLEDTALAQFNSAMEQDYAIKGALMPDAHTGYSLPIGGVVATEGAIVPAWVGYDIGCGMCAIPTNIQAAEVKKNAQYIYDAITANIPVGFNVHEDPQESSLDPKDLSAIGQAAFKRRKGFRSIGTLGGGNHFIEIGYDTQDLAWIIIHSGSRGIGHGIATDFMRLASGDGKVREGHYALRIDTDLGKSYINDMHWALAYALENRNHMMKVIIENVLLYARGEIFWDNLINRNHNHAELREGLWVHRKGATHADKDMLGVIPGNMRDGSFIVSGKGNPESLWSSSHGAGRVLGRRRAKEELSLTDFGAAMKGITANVCKDNLDEAPAAYKDIFNVMELQKDLVDIVQHIKPMINIKG